jgi:4'-phosphopantetheinyl transferase EntD
MDPREASVEALWSEEFAQVASTVPKRRLEYAAVRQLARPLIAACGGLPGPVLNNPDRSPRWPEGLVGSFSHTDSRAVAAIARQDAVLSLGCDVEENEPLRDDIADLILSPAELEIVRSRTPAFGKLMFSAKEACYKAQYGITRTFLDFPAIQVDFDCPAGRFNAIFSQDVGPFHRGWKLEGRYGFFDRWVGTAVTIDIDARIPKFRA